MLNARTHSSSVSVTRRGFIKLGAGSVTAWTLGNAIPARASASTPLQRCIFLNLVGGPSQLDTWDPKPDAPSDYRGPFRPINTNVPGMQISELFPRMARMAQEYALVRSIFHDEAPIHETGMQLVQTGQLVNQQSMHPHVGTCLASRFYSSGISDSRAMLIPGPLGNTGVAINQGQESLTVESALFQQSNLRLSKDFANLQQEYGNNHFGRACCLARRLIEQGISCITVNMFDSVYDCLSWDCHADGSALNVNLQDYRDRIAPMFDAAYTALLRDLKSRGLLESTLIVATGEFGRSPKINPRGGRDHWTGTWTALFAGGGVRGGQVIGASDSKGGEPIDRPVHASAVANTILHAAHLPWKAHYHYSEPIFELFGAKPTGSA